MSGHRGTTPIVCIATAVGLTILIGTLAMAETPPPLTGPGWDICTTKGC